MYISKFFSVKLCLLSLNICFNCENTRFTFYVDTCYWALFVAAYDFSFKSTSFPFIKSLYSVKIFYLGFLSNTDLNFL
jgi:hypothetical protein